MSVGFHRVAVVAGLLAASGLVADQAFGLEYTVTKLDFTASAINDAGQVTGYNASGPCVWTPGPGGGTLTSLPTLTNLPAFNNHQGLAINATGEVSSLGGNGATPLWTPGAGGYAVTNIGDVNPLGSEDIWATGLNDSGAVTGAGWDFSGGGGWTSFLWKPAVANGAAGTMVSLGKLPGDTPPKNTINNVGQIALTGNQAVLWNPISPNATTGSFYDLGSLSGSIGSSVANDINSKGQIVGVSTVGNTSHAFLWTPDAPNGVTGAMTDLGDLPGDQRGSKAFAINAAGVVVGKSGDSINSESIFGNACIWMADGVPENLNDLVDQSGAAWNLSEAVDINDGGSIIGSGTFLPDGGFDSFLLTPVPEPGTLGLSGGALVFLLRRRARGT